MISLLAGTDTSRYTMQWVIAFLAANPDVQRKMQQQIDDVCGECNLQTTLYYLTASYYPWSSNLCLEAVVDRVYKTRIFIECSCLLDPARCVAI